MYLQGRNCICKIANVFARSQLYLQDRQCISNFGICILLAKNHNPTNDFLWKSLFPTHHECGQGLVRGAYGKFSFFSFFSFFPHGKKLVQLATFIFQWQHLDKSNSVSLIISDLLWCQWRLEGTYTDGGHTRLLRRNPLHKSADDAAARNRTPRFLPLSVQEWRFRQCQRREVFRFNDPCSLGNVKVPGNHTMYNGKPRMLWGTNSINMIAPTVIYHNSRKSVTWSAVPHALLLVS